MVHLPTIKDVARAAGVHFTTVSMALRGDKRLRPETRDRIFAAVARVGYRRDAVSESLSRRRASGDAAAFTPRIAFLLNRSSENGRWATRIHRRLVKGAREQADAFGYGFELLFVDRGHHDSRSLDRYLKQNAIKGVIIGAFEPTRQTLELPWEEFCVVKIDSRHMAPACTYVSGDQMYAVRLSFERLRALGYRRIGLAVGQDSDVGTGRLSTCGLLLARMRIDRSEWVEPLFFPPGAGHTERRRVFGPWLQKESVEAVIANLPDIRRLISSVGVSCPEEVACVCTCMTQPSPGLAGVVANPLLVGRQATGLLLALLRIEEYGVPESPTSTYVQGTWSDGTSAPRRT